VSRIASLGVVSLLLCAPSGASAKEDDLGPVPPGARLVLTIAGGSEHRVGDALSAELVIHNDGSTWPAK
jgi:hypothetical protein